MFETMLGEFGDMPAAAVSRSRAFDLIESHIPVQAAKLRAQLGSAWDYVQAGPVKRVLSAEELGTLIKWLPNFSKAVADALTLYLWTCTRGSEIMAMEVR